MDLGVQLIVIGVMVVITAIFAAFEMALASISRFRLIALVNMKRPGAKEALFMKDRMEGSLAVVQLVVTLAGAISAAMGGFGADKYLSPILSEHWGMSRSIADIVSLVFLIIPLSCLTIIFAELIPKTYAIKHQVRVCLVLSPIMKALAFTIYPIISVIEKIVKRVMTFLDRLQNSKEQVEENTGLHELNAAVSLARTSRLLGVREEKIVLSAAQLSRRTVKEILLPIADVSMIPLNASLTDALIRAHTDMHTRFPVCREEGNPQTIEGYINFKDIMAGLKLNPSDPSIKGIMRPIKIVLSQAPISQVLEEMIGEKLHIAMVSSSDQRIVGMVTLEDIIEELVGEIEDEFDRMPNYIHPYGTAGWLMGGGVSMGVFVQTVGKAWPTLLPEEEKMKLADWFAQMTKNTPLKGSETIEANGVQIIARKLRRKKLGEAIVTLIV